MRTWKNAYVNLLIGTNLVQNEKLGAFLSELDLIFPHVFFFEKEVSLVVGREPGNLRSRSGAGPVGVKMCVL
jgi:hypothetical protein